MIGCGMTFSLFEFVKSNVDEFTEQQPEHVVSDESC